MTTTTAKTMASAQQRRLRSERVQARLTPPVKQVIEQAADLCGLSVSDFMVNSSRERAEALIRERGLRRGDHQPAGAKRGLARVVRSASRRSERHVGWWLLRDALQRCVSIQQTQLGAVVVVVDAVDEHAVLFYQGFGFISFDAIPDKLYIPIATIRTATAAPAPARQQTSRVDDDR